jgi:hypothetical protein
VLEASTTGGVAYLTTIAVFDCPRVPLWRVVAGGGDLWCEKFRPKGWYEENELHKFLQAPSTVRLSPSDARLVAEEYYGASWQTTGRTGQCRRRRSFAS